MNRHTFLLKEKSKQKRTCKRISVITPEINNINGLRPYNIINFTRNKTNPVARTHIRD